jgi:hypothetical protein
VKIRLRISNQNCNMSQSNPSSSTKEDDELIIPITITDHLLQHTHTHNPAHPSVHLRILHQSPFQPKRRQQHRLVQRRIRQHPRRGSALHTSNHYHKLHLLVIPAGSGHHLEEAQSHDINGPIILQWTNPGVRGMVRPQVKRGKAGVHQ